MARPAHNLLGHVTLSERRFGLEGKDYKGKRFGLWEAQFLGSEADTRVGQPGIRLPNLDFAKVMAKLRKPDQAREP